MRPATGAVTFVYDSCNFALSRLPRSVFTVPSYWLTSAFCVSSCWVAIESCATSVR